MGIRFLLLLQFFLFHEPSSSFSQPINKPPDLVLQKGHLNEVEDLAFSSDGNWLASLDDKKLKIWDLLNRRLYASVDFEDFECTELTWTGDNKHIYILGKEELGDIQIKALDIATLDFRSPIEVMPQPRHIITNSWLLGYHASPNHLSIVISERELSGTLSTSRKDIEKTDFFRLRIINPSTAETIEDSPPFTNYINGAVWDPDHQCYLLAVADGNLYAWTPGTSKAKVLVNAKGRFSNLSLQGDKVASLVDNGEVITLDIQRHQVTEKRKYIDDPGYFYARAHPMLLLPDGSLILSVKAKYMYKIARLRGKKEEYLFESDKSRSRLSCISFHPGRNLVAFHTDNGVVEVWDINNDKLFQLKGFEQMKFDKLVWVSENKSVFGFSGNSEWVYAFDLGKGGLNIYPLKTSIKNAIWSETQKEWVLADRGIIQFYDMQFQLKDEITLNLERVGPKGIQMTHRGMELVSVNGDGTKVLTHSGTRFNCGLNLWDRKSLRPISSFAVGSQRDRVMIGMEISNDGEYCWVKTMDNTAANHKWFVIDLNSKKKLFSGAFEAQLAFSKSGDSVFVASRWPTYQHQIMDLKSRKKVLQVSAEKNQEWPGKEWVEEASNKRTAKIARNISAKIVNGNIELHRAGEAQAFLSLFAEAMQKGKKNKVRDPFFLFYDASGYYLASSSLTRHAQFGRAGKMEAFESVNQTFNRPDKVLESLGFSSPGLIELYKKAWEKKQSVLEKNSLYADFRDQNSVKIGLKNSWEIPLNTQEEKVQLTLQIEGIPPSAKQALTLKLAVNEVPDPAFSVVSSIDDRELDFTVPLSLGMNRISLFLMDDEGKLLATQSLAIERLPEPLKVKPKLFYVGIGVSSYQQEAYNLTYSAKDVKDLGYFLERFSADYEVESLILTNRQVMRDRLDSVANFLSQASPNDRLIMLFSGHGLLNEQLDLFLASWNIDFQNPEQKGLRMAAFERLLQRCRAREKVFFVDACHSGWIDQEQPGRKAVVIPTKVKMRGVGPKTNKPTFSLPMESAFQIMSRLFTFTNQGNGASLITAASGAEFAYESDQLQNGLFTHVLLDGIRSGKADLNGDTKILLSELKQYLEEGVEKISDGNQKPTSRYLNPYEDFIFSELGKTDYSQLHQAASKGDVARLKQLIVEKGIYVNGTDEEGFAALHYAARQGQANAVDLLMRLGADVEQETKVKFTPLYLAIYNGNRNCADILVKNGAKTDPEHLPFQAIEAIFDRNDMAMLDIIDPPSRVSDIRKSYFRLLRHLVTGERELAFDLVDSLKAAQNFNPDHMDLRVRNRSLLFFLVIRGSMVGVENMLKFGADPNFPSQDYRQFRPLHGTIVNSQQEMARLLIKSGANPNLQDAMGYSPLYTAVSLEKREMVRAFIKLGSDPNLSDLLGKTPLHIAVDKNNLEIAKILLEAGANPMQPNVVGWTPLDYAKSRSLVPLVELLKKK